MNEVSTGFEEPYGDNNGGSSSDDSIDRTPGLAATTSIIGGLGLPADFSAKVGSKTNNAGSSKQPKQHKTKSARVMTGKLSGSGNSNSTLASTIASASSNNNSNNNASANTSRLFVTKQCPMARVGSLIGTRGSVIREVMKRTGTSIMVGDIPDLLSGVDFREVTIRGAAGGVAEAEKLIQGIIDIGTKVLNGAV